MPDPDRHCKLQGIADLEAFLRQALAAPLPGPVAQQRFAPGRVRASLAPRDPLADTKVAGVLLLIHPGPAGPTFPLTVRHARLRRHGGQVSLPGGTAVPGESPRDAALRETYEEIGVPPAGVRILGPLSTVWIAVSRFLVHPFVAITDERPVFRPDAGEVELLLEVPVADVRDPARLTWTRWPGSGDHEPLTVPSFDLGSRMVWGATAMILGEFACLFDAGHAPPPAGS